MRKQVARLTTLSSSSSLFLPAVLILEYLLCFNSPNTSAYFDCPAPNSLRVVKRISPILPRIFFRQHRFSSFGNCDPHGCGECLSDVGISQAFLRCSTSGIHAVACHRDRHTVRPEHKKRPEGRLCCRTSVSESVTKAPVAAFRPASDRRPGRIRS